MLETANVDSDSGYQSIARGQASKNYAKFYPKSLKNNFKSEQEGKDVYETQDFVMIICPGQPKSEVHEKVKDSHKREFPEQWAAYSAGKEQRISGTPIELLPGLPEGRADLYKSFYVHSIEQLAELSDPAKQKIGMGTTEDQNRAKAFLSKNTAEVVVLRQQLAAREAEAAKQAQTIAQQAEMVQGLQSGMEEMRQQIAELSAKRKPGRPRKNAAQPQPAAAA